MLEGLVAAAVETIAVSSRRGGTPLVSEKASMRRGRLAPTSLTVPARRRRGGPDGGAGAPCQGW